MTEHETLTLTISESGDWGRDCVETVTLALLAPLFIETVSNSLRER